MLDAFIDEGAGGRGRAAVPDRNGFALEPRSSAHDAARPLALLLLRGGGLPRARLEAATGLPLARLDDARARVGRGAVNRLWALAEEVLGEPTIGLRLARLAPRSRHLVCHLAKRTRTVGEMLATWEAYAPLICEAEALEVEELEEGVLVTRRLLSPRHENRSASEHALARLLGALKEFTGLPAPAREVRFRHRDPGYGTAYRETFRCEARFGAEEDALLLEPGALERPLRTRDAYLHQILKEHAAALLAQDRDPVVEAWRRIARGILGGEECPFREVAAHLHVSERTLNRVLTQRGASYRALLDAARRDLALREIGNGRPLREVCERLRFSEPTTLSRAFVRWFGMSISEYRKRHPAPSPERAPDGCPVRASCLEADRQARLDHRRVEA
ncbi:AraC family transcriptional regulator [Hasllibacter halocynthiae]|uniref:AraC family transcriptional regulator n=1 Tax=Hasllibacter halocynthiae TaxID=595589 RepID=A0A2T0WZB5_9RHOB|nr:AraC family transcriptional regulator [Hasllibacter halocynthiae]PRY92052.1 AraC family transcriptional regulator [Hasllibacter halocynthiae]